MDAILGGNSSKKEGGGDNHNPAKDNHGHHAPSNSELLASAKIVSDAAKAQMGNKEYDHGKAAGAAANILNAASHYGKLDESTGLGKIVDKAEDYLHNYSTTTKTTTTTHGTDGKHTTTTQETATHTTGHPTDGHEKSGHGGGGYGDLVKMAGDFVKKH